MNYKQLYTLFLKNQRMKLLNPNLQYELHHVVPKCKGGSNHPSNLIWLTRREHAHAHLLLHHIYKDDPSMFWPIQWFFNILTPSIQNLFNKKRKMFANQQNRDYLTSYKFRYKQSKKTTKIWKEQKERLLHNRNSIQYRQNQSIVTKTTYQKRSKNIKDETTGRFPNRKIYAEGTIFNSMTDCASAYKIHTKTIYNRVKKDTWSEWYYVD